MQAFPKRLGAVLAVYILIAFLVRVACGAELPMPGMRPKRYGCQIDHVGGKDVMPGQLVHVWAEFEAADKWSRILSFRADADPPRALHGYLPRVKPDEKARTKALKDCDKWMAAMDLEVKKQVAVGSE